MQSEKKRKIVFIKFRLCLLPVYFKYSVFENLSESGTLKPEKNILSYDDFMPLTFYSCYVYYFLTFINRLLELFLIWLRIIYHK